MIKISRLTDYAIVLLAEMAQGGDGLFAASDLAEKTKLPLPTVSKILKKLTKGHVLSAQRGAAGGYKLTGAPSAISVATLIEAMDGPIAVTSCADVDHAVCRIESTCPTRTQWRNRVNRALRAALEEVSLADMVVGESAAPSPLPSVTEIQPRV